MIDLPTELILLSGALSRLKLLPETESLKGAKQCLAAAIGWMERDIREQKPQ